MSKYTLWALDATVKALEKAVRDEPEDVEMFRILLEHMKKIRKREFGEQDE